MNDYTRGPWKVTKHPLRENGFGIGSNDPGLLATVSNRDNARLIAEAPEMLKACVEIVDCIRDCNSCDATGIEMGTNADACYTCGGVGQVLGGDDIFAAFTARDILERLK